MKIPMDGRPRLEWVIALFVIMPMVIFTPYLWNHFGEIVTIAAVLLWVGLYGALDSYGFWDKRDKR